MISSLNTIEEFNQLFIDAPSEQRDLFLPYDELTCHALTNNRIEELRVVLEDTDHDYEHHSNVYRLVHGEIEGSSYTFDSTYASNYLPLVYPYSKKSFMKQFFPEVLPSILNHVLSYMKATHRLIQLGNGSGKAMVLFAAPFTEEDLLHLKPIDYQTVISFLVNTTSLINNQQADINFLLEENKNLKTINNTLSLEHEQMQNTRAQDYLTTWR